MVTKNWLGRLPTMLVILLMATNIGVAVIAPILAQEWASLPFIGVFTENGVVVVSIPSKGAEAWAAYDQGAHKEQVITSINDQPIERIEELSSVLSQYEVGETIGVELRDQSGDSQTYAITLSNFPRLDLLVYFLLPYLIGLIFLGSGFWVFVFRRQDITGKTFAIFTSAVSIASIATFDYYTTHQLVYIWTLAICVLGGSFINMGLFLPQEEENPWLIKFPILRWFAYIPSLVIFLFACFSLFDLPKPIAYVEGRGFAYIYAALGFTWFIGRMLLRRFRDPSPIVREQARLIIWGINLGFLPIVVYLILESSSIVLGKTTPLTFSPLLLIFLIIFAIMTAYAIARYRLLQTDYIVSQIILFSTLSLAAAVGYAIIVTGLTLLFSGAFALVNPYMIGVMVFLLSIFFQPLRERVQQAINLVFNRSQLLYRERLQSFSRELTQALDAQAVVNTLREYIRSTIAPYQLHVFLFDPLTEQYLAKNDESGRPTSDLYFSLGSPLVVTLSLQRDSIYIGESKTLPASLLPDQARLGLLNAQLFVPLPGRMRLAGWFALSQKKTGEPYNSQDINLLEAMADQAALAVERAQVVSDLERRVNAMNVLTRIAQGINVTVAFDDILELIYAQTNLVIPTSDFRITLTDAFSDNFYHVFYLENDDRLREKEYQSLPLRQGLEQEIIRSRRPIFTDDYQRECRSRGVIPATKGIYSWIGVPLNTGKETIGMISLGSRDPSMIYTEEQANLLQAIADQAAGAIVKARLLEEAERRALQLATLNEVARSLSSTLELAPLFNQILNSAVEILNCEAGSLLLVDLQTKELVFEAAVGPVASELLGQKLPSGTGLVGKAVDTRQAIIVNDVRRTKDWFEKSDQQTGFTTNDLLVVPMVFKDQVTGVVEVINRNDGMPFTPDDQELLTAFSSQAAVALENARLYTRTDETLAARVDELSILQRIDRELNASLDVNRAMRLTLDWAMRQLGANAGMVGIIESNNVRVMAHQGYLNELDKFKGGLPLDIPTIKASIDTGTPQIVTYNGHRDTAVLSGAKEQIVVPIRREDEVIGLLMLESKEAGAYSEDSLAFLIRLMDHASIAIANAQLYSEVQSANQAKSDFVSFVSHELKTPMTSIRGFTDLLAAGVVGTVNENQANFLSTIRSNVDRMATLVSDLADISRIEAGRLRLDFTPVSVLEVIEDVTRSLSKQIEEKGQTLDLEVADLLPLVWGDKTRLVQILTNLVSNAYKYSPPEGKISIKVEEADNLWTEGSPKVIHLYVHDTGYGISPENQKKIFQKFFRSDDQKIRDAPGTGLGLNITKQLVELQGGHIWFESEFRAGTTFHVILPIAETTT